MERPLRKPYQGVTNIVWFNDRYYGLAVVLIISVGTLSALLPDSYTLIIWDVLGLVFIASLVSLAVSWYIYDYSGLYELEWLDRLPIKHSDVLVNINAGFDETSAFIAYKYPANKLLVFDFYDPEKHTEPSIKKARAKYPAYNGTTVITTGHIPLDEESVNYVFLLLAAHEIRHNAERIQFFKLLNKKLASNGRVVVVEHQRDLANFLAFNFGFFHFYSPANWQNTFHKSGFKIESKTKYTPFISIYTLAKNGTTP